MRQVTLTKDLKERILYYWEQKYLPKMMGKSKGLPGPISIIYHWIYHGYLEFNPCEIFYPRKGKREVFYIKSQE